MKNLIEFWKVMSYFHILCFQLQIIYPLSFWQAWYNLNCESRVFFSTDNLLLNYLGH